MYRGARSGCRRDTHRRAPAHRAALSARCPCRADGDRVETSSIATSRAPLSGRTPRAARIEQTALAECPTPATDERPCSHPPPVMVHRRRVRQFEFDHADRLHGGVLVACLLRLAGGGFSLGVALDLVAISPVSPALLAPDVITSGRLCSSTESPGVSTPTARQMADSSARAIFTAVAFGLSRFSRAQQESALVLAFEDLEGQLQVDCRCPPWSASSPISVITARYLPAGIGSKSLVGSTWLASKPCEISHGLVLLDGYGGSELAQLRRRRCRDQRVPRQRQSSGEAVAVLGHAGRAADRPQDAFAAVLADRRARWSACG